MTYKCVLFGVPLRAYGKFCSSFNRFSYKKKSRITESFEREENPQTQPFTEVVDLYFHLSFICLF